MASTSTRSLAHDIAAPLDVVWAILVDVRRLPDISPSTVGVDGPVRLERVGDRFEQTVKLAGKKFTSTWTVTAFEDRRLIEVTGSVLPGTRYSMTERLAPRGEDRTELRLDIEYSLPFGPVGRLAAKLGAERRALDEAEGVVRSIAALAERDAAGAAPRS